MKNFTLRQLIYLDGHLGHKTAHPDSSQYLYGFRNGLMIINLEKTITHLRASLRFIEELTKSGGTILFVVDNQNMYVEKQISSIGQTIVSSWSWVSGILTNFKFSHFSPLRGIPDAIIYLGNNPRIRKSITKEVTKLNIPLVSLVDSNESSLGITYPIPSNNDSRELLYLYLSLFINSIRIGRTRQLEKK